MKDKRKYNREYRKNPVIKKYREKNEEYVEKQKQLSLARSRASSLLIKKHKKEFNKILARMLGNIKRKNTIKFQKMLNEFRKENEFKRI